MQTRRAKIKGDQSGFASIVIALILILVLSLITVGFAQLMQREQRSALDKQLSSQAYYAAESGINDGASAVAAGFDVAKTTCGGYTSAAIASLDAPSKAPAQQYLANNTVGSDTGANYPCLLINPSPSSLYYTGVQPDTAENVIFGVTGTAPPLTLTIEWDSADRNTFPSRLTTSAYPGTNDFKPTTNWPYPGVIQFSVTPLGSPLTRSSLIYNTFTTYLYPEASSANYPRQTGTDIAQDRPSEASDTDSLRSSVYYNTTTTDHTQNWQGQLDMGSCVASGTGSQCTATIQNIQMLSQNCPNTAPAAANPTSNCLLVADPAYAGQDYSYLIHFLDLYDTSNITITGTGITGFNGGQILIDSTGKAQDVLRRLQVRVAVGSGSTNSDLPSYALQGANICKREQTGPTSATNPNGTDFIGINNANVDGITDPCNPEN